MRPCACMRLCGRPHESTASWHSSPSTAIAPPARHALSVLSSRAAAMPLNFTAAPSSRISRGRVSKPGGRGSSLPKSLLRSSSSASPQPARLRSTESVLQDLGYLGSSLAILSSTPAESRPKDVPSAISWAKVRLFAPLPDRGIHPDKLHQLALFRTRAPPFIPLPLVHALISSPTAVTREVHSLAISGVVRQLAVGRHAGIVPTDALYTSISTAQGLPAALADKFTALLRANPTVPTLPARLFAEDELRALVAAGFLTMAAMLAQRSSVDETQRSSTLTSLAAIAASGTVDAVGGRGIVTSLGYSQPGVTAAHDAEYTVAMPSLGPLLGAMRGARDCVNGMLRKQRSGVLVKTLHERWDGGAVKGKSRMWRDHKGLSLEAVLGELLGRGDVEAFKTPMGPGVRLRGA